MAFNTALLFSILVGLGVLLITSSQPLGKRRATLRQQLRALTGEAATQRRRRAEAAARVKPILDGSEALNNLIQPPFLMIGATIDRMLRRDNLEESRLERWLSMVDPDNTPASFRAQQFALGVMAVGFLAFIRMIGFSPLASLPPITWFAVALAVSLFPWMDLRNKVRKRRETALAEVPSFVELLLLGNSAGQSMELAVEDAGRRFVGPLGEIVRDLVSEAAVQERTYVEGMRYAAEREDLPPLEQVAAAWELSREGTPISGALDQLARDLTQQQSLVLIEAAGKSQLKMLGPTLMLIFPAFLLAVLFPVISVLVDQLSGIVS